MRAFFNSTWLLGLIVVNLSANTIDVSLQSSQLLQTGDSLRFLFSGRSYSSLASAMGMSAYPGSINFAFASLPVNLPGDFTIEVESADGTVSAGFQDAVGWTAGFAETPRYSGPISAVVGSLRLTDTLSQELFAGAENLMILTYSGSDVNVGLQGNDLMKDLSLDLSGGGLSVGAAVSNVVLDDEQSAAAEPNSAALIGIGLGLCLMVAVVFRQIGARPAQDVTP